MALELLYEVPYRPSTLWGQRQLDHFSRNWRKIQYFALKTALKSAKMNPICNLSLPSLPSSKPTILRSFWAVHEQSLEPSFVLKKWLFIIRTVVLVEEVVLLHHWQHWYKQMEDPKAGKSITVHNVTIVECCVFVGRWWGFNNL